MQGLTLENSHVRQVVITKCRLLLDCEMALSIAATQMKISKSRLEGLRLGIIVSKISMEGSSELVSCYLRVLEELLVRDSGQPNCTFQCSDEDRKDRQVISAVFYSSEIHGCVTLPLSDMFMLLNGTGSLKERGSAIPQEFIVRFTFILESSDLNDYKRF